MGIEADSLDRALERGCPPGVPVVVIQERPDRRPDRALEAGAVSLLVERQRAFAGALEGPMERLLGLGPDPA